MTPLLFHFLMLTVVAFKIVLVLVFLHWIDTRSEKTQAQAVGHTDQRHRAKCMKKGSRRQAIKHEEGK